MPALTTRLTPTPQLGWASQTTGCACNPCRWSNEAARLLQQRCLVIWLSITASARTAAAMRLQRVRMLSLLGRGCGSLRRHGWSATWLTLSGSSHTLRCSHDRPGDALLDP